MCGKDDYKVSYKVKNIFVQMDRDHANSLAAIVLNEFKLASMSTHNKNLNFHTEVITK